MPLEQNKIVKYLLHWYHAEECDNGGKVHEFNMFVLFFAYRNYDIGTIIQIELQLIL